MTDTIEIDEGKAEEIRECLLTFYMERSVDVDQVEKALGHLEEKLEEYPKKGVNLVIPGERLVAKLEFEGTKHEFYFELQRNEAWPTKFVKGGQTHMVTKDDSIPERVIEEIEEEKNLEVLNPADIP
jgi:hypothetical protein